MTSFVLYVILNTAFVLLVSPLFVSLVKKTKAYCQGRRGPSIFQTYFQLAKMMKKETVYSSTSSSIMRITPYVNITCMLAASLFVPLLFIPPALTGIGNVFLFLYLMVAAKFFMALAGLDAGSTFGGMGSSREMTLSAVMEPVVIIVFATLAFVLHTTNLHEMLVRAALMPLSPPILLISISLFIILIVETSRIPVDNPETHLELTMIHEAMILEFSGPNLALMELSHTVKQTLLMGFLVNLLMPWGLAAGPAPAPLLLAAILFVLKGSLLAVVVGIFESSLSKLRLFRLPALFMQAFFFAFVTILFELLGRL
ncbi:MAG: NADH-quinone oxidoreductase subunit H [Dehalococcoidales bacterium]|nr:NADH-quinone oxidoreductase subunit H [Dehalococcoidales bacterium]